MNALNVFSTIALLFCGESIAIYSEVGGAYDVHLNGITLKTILLFFTWITLAGVPLLAGYFIGILAFGNIWIVSVISITVILIVEPVLAFAIFRQLPTTGAIIGFMLGSVGLIVTLFVK